MKTELVSDTLTLYKAKKNQCKLSTLCSFLNNLFTVTGNNNTMYNKNRIGDRNFHYKLPIIVFQINAFSLIESEAYRDISIRLYITIHSVDMFFPVTHNKPFLQSTGLPLSLILTGTHASISYPQYILL